MFPREPAGRAADQIRPLVIDTNVNGPFLMARAAVPAMLERGSGRIVNVSMNRETMRRRGFSPYGPSKAALESETAIWAQDLGDSGITVNAVHPGVVNTGFAKNTGGLLGAAWALMRPFLITPEKGARTSLRAASDPGLDGVTGRYFSHGRPKVSSAESRDEAVPLLGRQRGDHEAHAIAAAEIAPECAPDGIAEPFAVGAAIEHFGHGAAIGHGADGDIAERHADFAALAARVAVAQPREQSESAIGAGDEVPGG